MAQPTNTASSFQQMGSFSAPQVLSAGRLPAVGQCVRPRVAPQDPDVAGLKLSVGGDEQAEFVSASGGGRMPPNDRLPPEGTGVTVSVGIAPSLCATR
jgi:hypothetical protein